MKALVLLLYAFDPRQVRRFLPAAGGSMTPVKEPRRIFADYQLEHGAVPAMLREPGRT